MQLLCKTCIIMTEEQHIHFFLTFHFATIWPEAECIEFAPEVSESILWEVNNRTPENK